MGKVIFCEITWMKDYAGITAEDQPKNGGSFVKENGEAGECKNFLPYNHRCYGYVQHNGSELNLARIEDVGSEAEKLEDVTVVWVARSTVRKIVGWYEHATVYRFMQEFTNDVLGEQNDSLYWWGYYCSTKEENAYLLPERDRCFTVPSASKTGAGKGMGQSMVWYADSVYAREEFLPKVMAYLALAKRRTAAIYWMPEELQQLPGIETEELGNMLERAADLFDAGEFYESLQYDNLARQMNPCFEVLFMRGWALEGMLLYDEAIEEYKNALQEKGARLAGELVECRLKLAYLYMMVHKNHLAWQIYEELLQQRIDGEVKCDVLINMMHICVEDCSWDKLQDVLARYEKRKTDYRREDAENFRQILQEETAEKQN